jgi:hypothetical protein
MSDVVGAPIVRATALASEKRRSKASRLLFVHSIGELDGLRRSSNA